MKKTSTFLIILGLILSTSLLAKAQNKASNSLNAFTTPRSATAESQIWSAPFGDGHTSTTIWPEGSVAQSSVKSDYVYLGEDDVTYNTYLKSTSSTNNKYFTPLLRANAGDILSFSYRRESYYVTNWVKVYLTTDRRTFGEPITTIENLTTNEWGQKTIAIPNDGDYYVAFEMYNACVDNINGLHKVNVDHDLYIRDFGSFYTGTEYQSGESITKEVYVIPAIGANADDYTVEAILGDEVVATVDSKNLSMSSTSASSFQAKFSKTVATTSQMDLYWRFTFTDDNTVFESDRLTLTIICEPKFCFVTKGTNDSSTAPKNVTSHDFGKVNSANITANYEIFNWGRAPLTVKSVTVPEGFSTSFTTPATITAKQHVDFPVSFIATQKGTYSGKIVITYVNAAGEDEDFEFTVNGTILDPSKFYTTFDNQGTGEFPAGSLHDSSVYTYNYGNYYSPDYVIYSTAQSNNMFITPLLHAEEGEIISFKGKRYSSDGTVTIYSASTRENLRDVDNRTLVAEIKCSDVEDPYLMTNDFKTFYATIAQSGDYYIGFEIYNAYVDEIYGLNRCEVAHDLQLAGFSIPETAMQNSAVTATVQLRNFGLQAEAAGSYTAIITVNGVEIEVSDLPEIPMTHDINGTPVTLNIPFRYSKVGTYPVSAKLKFGDYELETESSDIVFTEEILSDVKTIGEFYRFDDYPYCNNYMNQETIALYTPEQLGLNGGETITSIAIRGYHYLAAHNSDVKIYYAWVDQTTLDMPTSNSNYDTSAMTLVCDKENFYWPGGTPQNVLDLFTLDFGGDTYPAGKSLLLLFTNYSSSYKQAANSEISNWDGNCYVHYNDGSKGVMTGSWNKKRLPMLHISLAVEPKTFSGVVTDQEDNVIEGATVVLTDTEGLGVEYSGETDANGAFNIKVIQSDRTYNATIKYGGLKGTASDIAFDESVSMNFKLEEIPVVTIHPNATGIEAAEEVNVHFNLDLTPGYHALALPFAIDSDLVTEIFGNNAEVYSLVRTVLEDGNLLAFFETTYSVEAGKPFLVNVTETTDKVIEGVAIVAEPMVDTESSRHAIFSANYEATPADGKFVFNQDGFIILPEYPASSYARIISRAGGNTDEEMVPAFHATLQPLPDYRIGSMNFAINQTRTGIEEISVEFPEGEFIDLRGIRTKNPTKGIYIINSKKVIIK